MLYFRFDNEKPVSLKFNQRFVGCYGSTHLFAVTLESLLVDKVLLIKMKLVKCGYYFLLMSLLYFFFIFICFMHGFACCWESLG